MPVTKADWLVAIEERAEQIYAGLPLTKEQLFSKAIGGSAESVRGTVYDGGDKLARLYFEAMKVAPRAPVEAPEPPVDVHKAMAKRSGPASMAMLELARTHQARDPKLSDAAAYTRAYTDPKNVELKEKVLAENWSLIGLGDTEYMRVQNAPYSNPHPAGSGPRP